MHLNAVINYCIHMKEWLYAPVKTFIVSNLNIKGVG